MAMLANEVHRAKALVPMRVTASGISMLAKLLQPAKMPPLRIFTRGGIARLANELHPSKALIPMLATDDEISRLANELHPLKT